MNNRLSDVRILQELLGGLMNARPHFVAALGSAGYQDPISWIYRTDEEFKNAVVEVKSNIKTVLAILSLLDLE